MNAMPVISTRSVPVFEFEELAAMPCGCVTAAYRAAQWEVLMVSIETKGTYCVHQDHFAGQVVELGDVFERQSEPAEARMAG